MDRQVFFDAVRASFGGTLDGDQVAGMGTLLDAGRDLPLHHMANVLAQVRRETGGIMAPIKETVQASHKNRNPTDAEVIRRLDKAFAAGKLPWVKKPYWRDGEFGRGQIQVTHEFNRKKLGISNRDDLLKLDVSARVTIKGMTEGIFTGKKLSDYNFPAALDLPPKQNPRRIVNGQDGSDAQVAKFHRQFVTALEKAGWGTNIRVISEQPPRTAESIDPPHVEIPPPSSGAGGIVAVGVALAAAAAAVASWWENFLAWIGF